PPEGGSSSTGPLPAACEHAAAPVRDEPREEDENNRAGDRPQPGVLVDGVRADDEPSDPEPEEPATDADDERPEEPDGVAPRHEQTGDRAHDEPSDHDPDDGPNSHLCSLPGRSPYLYPGTARQPTGRREETLEHLRRQLAGERV